jgi:hypothetical protein
VQESNVELACRLGELETKYDAKLEAVFEAIRQLMAQPFSSRNRIGFRPEPLGYLRSST